MALCGDTPAACSVLSEREFRVPSPPAAGAVAVVAPTNKDTGKRVDTRASREAGTHRKEDVVEIDKMRANVADACRDDEGTARALWAVLDFVAKPGWLFLGAERDSPLACAALGLRQWGVLGGDSADPLASALAAQEGSDCVTVATDPVRSCVPSRSDLLKHNAGSLSDLRDALKRALKNAHGSYQWTTSGKTRKHTAPRARVTKELAAAEAANAALRARERLAWSTAAHAGRTSQLILGVRLWTFDTDLPMEARRELASRVTDLVAARALLDSRPSSAIRAARLVTNRHAALRCLAKWREVSTEQDAWCNSNADSAVARRAAADADALEGALRTL
jgi:hypothetical protein